MLSRITDIKAYSLFRGASSQNMHTLTRHHQCPASFLLRFCRPLRSGVRADCRHPFPCPSAWWPPTRCWRPPPPSCRCCSERGPRARREAGPHRPTPVRRPGLRRSAPWSRVSEHREAAVGSPGVECGGWKGEEGSGKHERKAMLTNE